MRARLALLSLLTVVPALGLTIYTQVVERRQARHQRLDDTARLVRLAAERQSQTFTAANQFLADLAQIDTLRGDKGTGCDDVLRQLLAEHPNYINVTVVRSDGTHACSARPIPARMTPALVRGRPWFQRAMESRSMIIGDYAPSVTGEPGLVVARAVRGSAGNVDRVVTATLSLTTLQWASDLDLPTGSTIALFDGPGRILARHPALPGAVGTYVSQPIRDGRGSDVAFVDPTGADGMARVYAVANVKRDGVDTGLSVALGTDPSAVVIVTDRLLAQQAWLLAIVALAVMMVAFVSGEFFIRRPLEDLTQVTARIAAGDLSARATLHRGFPGLVELGAAVDRMGAALETRQQEREQFDQRLQEAEARMEFALDAAHVGVWNSDLTTGRAYWSDICERMHGVAPGRFGGTIDAFLDCIHDDDRARVRDTIERAIAARQDAELEYCTVWPDGTEHRIVSTAHFVYDSAGAPLRGAGITRDVTERRSLEEQLRQSQKMEAVGQLAGGIAHDFNNMLTTILGYADLISGQIGPDKPLGRDLAEIRAAAQRASALTRQLLAFSRKQVLSLAPLNLTQVVRNLEPMLRRLLGERVAIETDVAEDLAPVVADAVQMEHALINLAVNARDAMPNGGRLTIVARNTTMSEAAAGPHGVAAGPYVMVSVTDTGVGIPSDILPRVFEPFFTTKEPGRGTGLGLAVVYGTVKQLGGLVHVDSEPGRGSTFALYVPQVAPPQQQASIAKVETPQPGTETVLLVEDEPNVRAFTATSLRRFGYSIVEADSAEAALARLDEFDGPIDLLLSDVMLPGMDGCRLAVSVTRIRPTTRVLLMSGYAPSMLDQPLDLKAQFLPKPFTAQALLAKVRDALIA